MKLQKIFIAHSWIDVGVNIQTKAVAKQLSEDYKVLFISQARTGAPLIKENINLEVIEWPNKRPNKLKDFFFICKQIIKEKPQVIIVHFGATNITMIASWLLGVKHRICWMHTLTQQYYLDTTNQTVAKKNIGIRRRIYSLATKIVVLNEYARNDAREGYLIPERKIFKIYNGIYPIPAGKVGREGVKSVRYIGRLDRSKGVDILLQAFAEVVREKDNVQLDIAGGGPELESVLKWIKDHRLEKKVFYHGYFTDYQKSRKFISEAFCLVVPSRIDNFPTVILEALSAAVPVIASNIAGIPDMIEQDVDGLLVEVENVQGFAMAMKLLLDDVDLRDRLSINASKNFERKFSMDKHLINVAALVKQLLTA